jgi:hypothetical protein
MFSIHQVWCKCLSLNSTHVEGDINVRGLMLRTVKQQENKSMSIVFSFCSSFCRQSNFQSAFSFASFLLFSEFVYSCQLFSQKWKHSSQESDYRVRLTGWRMCLEYKKKLLLDFFFLWILLFISCLNTFSTFHSETEVLERRNPKRLLHLDSLSFARQRSLQSRN